MITKAEAMDANEFHFGECTKTVGPHGGVKIKQIRCRRSGRTQTWVTRPADFRVPVKYGLYESGEVTHTNATQWHAASACPLNREG